MGNLNPPQVHYSYVISRPSNGHFKWQTRSLSKWSHCDRQCQGKQYSSTAVCVKDSSNEEVDEKHCSYLPRPKSMVKSCNMHCSLVWREVNRGPCSARCGPGKQEVKYACMRIMANQPEMVLHDRYCEEQSQKPLETVECEGQCEGVKWRYGHWSEVNHIFYS